MARKLHGFGGLVEISVWVAVDILGFCVLGEIVDQSCCDGGKLQAAVICYDMYVSSSCTDIHRTYDMYRCI